MGSRGKLSLMITGAAAGVTLGGVIAYLVYRKRKEDTDEGIGDVDSIVSEGEVEKDSERQRQISESQQTPDSTSSPVVTSPPGDGFDDDVIDDSGDIKEAAIASGDVIEESGGGISEEEFDALMEEQLDVRRDSIDDDFKKVLLLGLDRAGKSTLLDVMAKRRVDPVYRPTYGQNTVQMSKGSVALTLMEIGGSAEVRKFWSNFTEKLSMLVYVVDAADDGSNLDLSLSLLESLLKSADLNRVPCLLIANKQDVDGARPAAQIFTPELLARARAAGADHVTTLDVSCAPERVEQSSDLLLSRITAPFTSS